LANEGERKQGGAQKRLLCGIETEKRMEVNAKTVGQRKRKKATVLKKGQVRDKGEASTREVKNF